MSSPKIIVGLGNPGREYAHNRHNAGFRCINYLAREHGVSLSERSCRAQFGVGRIAGHEVVLAKPRTYMNSSGDSVSLLVRRFKTCLDDLFVIHDDLDIPLGKLRFYFDGGSGGHKGIESIVGRLGSRDFNRLRLGIGRPPESIEAAQYVLTDFNPMEASTFAEVVRQVGEAIPLALAEGVATAMNKYH